MLSFRMVGLCLAGAATMLIAAAQTSPEDATSNLAAWYEFAGSFAAPDWLATPMADEWGLRLGVIGLLIAAVMILFPWRLMKRRLADKNATRRELICRWREAVLAAQDEADKLTQSRTDTAWPDNMIYVHEAKHILEKFPEYHEFSRVYRIYLLRSWFYRQWRWKSRMRRLFGLRPKPLLPNPDRTFPVGTNLHSHMYYMLRKIDQLEAWWRLNP